MTSKERKVMKHSLKTAIDRADTWIKLANTGENEGATDNKKISKTKEAIIIELKNIREEIVAGGLNFIEEIDKTIKKMS